MAIWVGLSDSGLPSRRQIENFASKQALELKLFRFDKTGTCAKKTEGLCDE
jgi:hypothetical protein